MTGENNFAMFQFSIIWTNGRTYKLKSRGKPEVAMEILKTFAQGEQFIKRGFVGKTDDKNNTIGSDWPLSIRISIVSVTANEYFSIIFRSSICRQCEKKKSVFNDLNF